MDCSTFSLIKDYILKLCLVSFYNDHLADAKSFNAMSSSKLVKL